MRRIATLCILLFAASLCGCNGGGEEEKAKEPSSETTEAPSETEEK